LVPRWDGGVGGRAVDGAPRGGARRAPQHLLQQARRTAVTRGPSSGVRLLLTAVALGTVVLLADTVPAFSAARRQMWGLHTLAYQEFREKLPARAIREIGRYVRGAGDGLPAPPPAAEPRPGRYG